MPTPFDDLRERLLIAGVAPHHIRRYIAELTDHLDDLRADGVGDQEAFERLGSVDHLTKVMADQPQLRTWTSRAPWATLVLGPVIALAAVTAAATLAIAVFKPSPSQQLPSLPLQSAVQGMTWALVFVIPLIIGWGLSAVAIQRRLAPLWPLLGLGLFALISGAYDFHVVFPQVAGGKGELFIGFGIAPPFADVPQNMGHCVMNFVLTAAPYALWYFRRRQLTAI